MVVAEGRAQNLRAMAKEGERVRTPTLPYQTLAENGLGLRDGWVVR